LHRSSQAVVDILPADTDAAVQMMKMTDVEMNGSSLVQTKAVDKLKQQDLSKGDLYMKMKDLESQLEML